jgi:hypothetical protein
MPGKNLELAASRSDFDTLRDWQSVSDILSVALWAQKLRSLDS